MDLLFKKTAILWVTRHLNYWLNVNIMANKRKTKAHDVKVFYLKKNCGLS